MALDNTTKPKEAERRIVEEETKEERTDVIAARSEKVTGTSHQEVLRGFGR